MTWLDGKAVVEYTVDEHKFRLRPVNNAYGFVSVTDPGERPLFHLTREDTQLSNRILVAIGKYVS